MFKRNGTGENSANLPLSLCPSLLTHPHLIYFFRLLHQCPYFHPFSICPFRFLILPSSFPSPNRISTKSSCVLCKSAVNYPSSETGRSSAV